MLSTREVGLEQGQGLLLGTGVGAKTVQLVMQGILSRTQHNGPWIGKGTESFSYQLCSMRDICIYISNSYNASEFFLFL